MENVEQSRQRPQFGNRLLTEVDDVFQHNAWDNVEWDDEQEQLAKEAVEKNSSNLIDEVAGRKFEADADKYWDAFYGIHQNRFFKDRHWLFTEFPELAPNVSAPERVIPDPTGSIANSDGSPENQENLKKVEVFSSNSTKSDQSESCADRRIFELGCGVGNTILPILKYSREPGLFVYGCDFSAKAIDILRQSTEFDASRCEVFVMDVASEQWNVPFAPDSIDMIVLIFVLSAIHPDKMRIVAANAFKYLKPGGLLLLRDYGRYDMAQLRFKPGKCLQENFYVRGDGTRVYFFSQEEIRTLFEDAGLAQEQNIVDRRLQVNRSRLLKMYRVWIQAKFRKPDIRLSNKTDCAIK